MTYEESKEWQDTEEPYNNKVIVNNTFTKHDSGKVLAAAVDPKYIIGTAHVLTFGAKKYERDNWKLATDKTRIEDALMRHLYAYLAGETTDPETNISHLYHASCNLMFLAHIDREKLDG